MIDGRKSDGFPGCSRFPMKKMVFVLVAAAALYFAWMRFGSPSGASRATSGDGRAANAQQRIDALSGAAPAE
jgi:hypothetical protein